MEYEVMTNPGTIYSDEPPVEMPTTDDDEMSELELSRMNDEGCPHD